MKKIKLCRVATVPFALFGSKKHLEKLEELGCEVTVICSPDENLNQILKLKIHKVDSIYISREISLIDDLKSTWNLYLYFKKNKFDIIHSNTPKAGLLVSIAAFLSRHPRVIHSFTGQRWATLTGFKKQLLKRCDQIIVSLNYICYADSWSQRNFLIEKGVGNKKNISCIHQGAFAGVDLNKFSLENKKFKKETILQEIGCDPSHIIITYLGRMVGDKGINELVTAFDKLKSELPHLRLLLIGPFEEGKDPLSVKTKEKISQDPEIITMGLCFDPEKYLSITNIFCLPSYREGFPTVVMEAAAMGVPSIVTNITGAKDSVINNITGILVAPHSPQSLIDGIRHLASSKEERYKMGIAAYKRVVADYTLDIVAQKNIDEYRKALK